MIRHRPRMLLSALLLCSALPALADNTAPKVAEFAWRAALQTPADAALLRLDLPAPALGALQSRSPHDIRIFDAQGQALPFAELPATPGTAQETPGPAVRALPMTLPARSGGGSMVARVEVRSNGKGAVQQMQVQWDSATPPAPGSDTQAALFDLRKLPGSIGALDVELSLPDNTPVHLQASLSKTLQQWQNLPTAGPLYQFAGPDAPRNTRLQFARAQTLEGHFLLLQWPAGAGVQVHAVRTRTLTTAPAPAVVEVGLPEGEPSRNGPGLEWTLPAGAQVQTVQWRTPQPNQLRTLALQGRRHNSSTWEPLGTVVVYHLVQNGEARHNPPHTLPAGAWRSLRLRDWPGGETPNPQTLQATLQLQPVTLAFLANGTTPYTLAVGRMDTPAAALPAATLASAAATPPTSWPVATVGPATGAPSLQAKRFSEIGRAHV